MIEGAATRPQKDQLDGNARKAIAPNALVDCRNVRWRDLLSRADMLSQTLFQPSDKSRTPWQPIN